MFSPSDYNDAVPQFSNGNYANEPLNPLYVEEPDSVNYKRGAEPLQTLPVQWWNWLWNKITAKLNNLNIYVKNIFNELAGLLSLVNVTPDATEEEVTTEQLKGMFATKYPQYLYDSDIFKTKYPQYLYDNFESEALLQGRTRGVMVAPTDTWNDNTNTLSLTGGFGIINTYHKVTFSNCKLVIPNDDSVHYIVSDTRGAISIQNSIANNVILIGLCSNKEYCLLIDNNPDQCKDSIILKKWFGKHKTSQDFVNVLKSYYNTNINSIETKISIETLSSTIGLFGGTFDNCTINIGTVDSYAGIRDGKYNNCTITIETVNSSGLGINNGTLNDCTITIKTINGGKGINGGTCNNCTITINTINSGDGINGGTFDNCTITINTIKSGYYIRTSTLNDCTITIGTVSGNISGVTMSLCGIYKGTLDNCTINIGTINSGDGIREATLNNCTITIGTVDDGYGIRNSTINNCIITIETVNYAYYDKGISNCISDNCIINIKTLNGGIGIYKGTFNNCTITIKTSSNNGQSIYNGTFNNCIINIETVDNGYGIQEATLNNCTINIKTVSGGTGIYDGTFNNCTITIETVSDGIIGIKDVSSVVLYFTYIKCSAITSLSNTAGKLNVLNDTVFHAS